jgi:hypothetical protein
VPHDHVALHARAAQIDVAILQPRLLGNIRVIADRKRGRPGIVEQADLPRTDLDRAGRDLGVDGFRRAIFDLPDDRDDELRAEPLGLAD